MQFNPFIYKAMMALEHNPLRVILFLVICLIAMMGYYVIFKNLVRQELEPNPQRDREQKLEAIKLAYDHLTMTITTLNKNNRIIYHPIVETLLAQRIYLQILMKVVYDAPLPIDERYIRNYSYYLTLGIDEAYDDTREYEKVKLPINTMGMPIYEMPKDGLAAHMQEVDIPTLDRQEPERPYTMTKATW